MQFLYFKDPKSEKTLENSVPLDLISVELCQMKDMLAQIKL